MPAQLELTVQLPLVQFVPFVQKLAWQYAFVEHPLVLQEEDVPLFALLAADDAGDTAEEADGWTALEEDGQADLFFAA